MASAISAAMSLRSKRTEITADKVLRELAKIGFADIRKAIKWQSALINEEDNPDGGDVAIIKTIVTNQVQHLKCRSPQRPFLRRRKIGPRCQVLSGR